MERLEVLQQKLEHWCATSVRALANDPSVQYRGHYLHVGGNPFPIRVPYLHLNLETHDIRKLRGVADSIALRLCYSDYKLHQKLCPENNLELLIFELLEQLRTESLLPEKLPGIRSNLRNRFLYWANETSNSELVESQAGLLVFTIAMVCWSRLLNEPMDEIIENLIESTRMALSGQVGEHLAGLRKHRSDQLAFSQHALAIAKTIHSMISGLSRDSSEEDDDGAVESLIKNSQLNLQWLDADSSLLEQNHGMSFADDIAMIENDVNYSVYTSAYDQEVFAVKKIRQAQLKKFRTRLDKRISQQSVNHHRLARYLQQLFSSPQLSGWTFGEEEGYLDSTRLTRLLTSPDDRRLFRKEMGKPSADCVVTILLDNSGSMTHHSEEVAALVDTLTRALEQAGMKTEILGFTTGQWNGGKAFKDWSTNGKPKNPGRLNELTHTIYKVAGTPWRRSRQAIAGLLKSELFREGIDGEALQWAVSRLAKRYESKKIIMMISDGSPMDTATQMANEDRYLDRHLKQVAKEIEDRPDINLCALGVGLDLSAYYSQSMPISINKELMTKDFFDIAELLSKAR
ncbi:MAG: cobaltochelatase CobT-related protein [Arenicella sp.]